MTKLLIVHGGAPTAVINASLCGAIAEAKRVCPGCAVFGAAHGTAGVLSERFIRLDALDNAALERLRVSPASALGTSRLPLEAADYARMTDILRRRGFTHVLFTGGNGSMDTCAKLSDACAGSGILVGGIPKTIDNDIGGIDHAPGYGSAARFAALSMLEIAQDIASLPIHVCIVEYMGRNTGWIAAASALAREAQGDAPHMLLLPEISFDEERFLAEVSRRWALGRGVIVAVSEGVRRADGSPIVPPVFASDRATYLGDASPYLTHLVIERLGVKAHYEKPGLLGRSCAEAVSPLDRDEAERLGALAARAVLGGRGGVMAALRRLPGEPYRCEETLIPLGQGMLWERPLPPEFLDAARFDVTDAFLRWARPLLGGPLPRFTGVLPAQEG